MGEKDGKVVNRHIQQVFHHFALSFMEVVLLKRKESECWRIWWKSRRRGISEKALSQGRGVILLTAHLGNWEVWEPGWVVKVILLLLLFVPLRFRLFGDLWKS